MAHYFNSQEDMGSFEPDDTPSNYSNLDNSLALGGDIGYQLNQQWAIEPGGFWLKRQHTT